MKPAPIEDCSTQTAAAAAAARASPAATARASYFPAIPQCDISERQIARGVIRVRSTTRDIKEPEVRRAASAAALNRRAVAIDRDCAADRWQSIRAIKIIVGCCQRNRRIGWQLNHVRATARRAFSCHRP